MNMWFPSQLYMRKDVGFKTSFDGKQGMNRMFEPLRYVVCTPLFGKPMTITKTSNGWGAKNQVQLAPSLVRRDFEDWNIQFWGYMLLRHKCRKPQNRSNNRRPGNYGNDWVESFKTASKQMYVVFVSIHLDPCGTCGILATFGYGAKSLTLVCHHLGGVLCS